jgi:hypothetical protein
VTQTDLNVYQVVASFSGPGSSVLRAKASASFDDLFGNTLSGPITDDTTITVQARPAPPPVYEPFNYTEGGLNGQGGTSETGLDGVWLADSTTLVTSDMLLVPGLPNEGNSIGKLTYYSNRYGGARTVSASALAGKGLLDDGATLWFSLIMGYGRDANGTAANRTNARLAFALANNTFNTGNFDYWIKDDGALLGSGIGPTLGRFDGVNGRIIATQFQDISQGDGYAGNVFGSWTGEGTTLGQDEYALIVGKLTWGAASDTLELYQPGEGLALPANPISVLTVSVDQSTYDTITFTRGDPVVLDEIRFAATYDEVIGIAPPPGGTLLIVK